MNFDDFQLFEAKTGKITVTVTQDFIDYRESQKKQGPVGSYGTNSAQLDSLLLEWFLINSPNHDVVAGNPNELAYDIIYNGKKIDLKDVIPGPGPEGKGYYLNVYQKNPKDPAGLFWRKSRGVHSYLFYTSSHRYKAGALQVGQRVQFEVVRSVKIDDIIKGLKQVPMTFKYPYKRQPTHYFKVK